MAFGREGTDGGDRREQPPAEASEDREGISEGVLFFQELIQPPESVCYGLLLHQLWFRLMTIILCRSPSNFLKLFKKMTCIKVTERFIERDCR
jgi:hypothetical protein